MGTRHKLLDKLLVISNPPTSHSYPVWFSDSSRNGRQLRRLLSVRLVCQFMWARCQEEQDPLCFRIFFVSKRPDLPLWVSGSHPGFAGVLLMLRVECGCLGDEGSPTAISTWSACEFSFVCVCVVRCRVELDFDFGWMDGFQQLVCGCYGLG